jgi:hypothetical protein
MSDESGQVGSFDLANYINPDHCLVGFVAAVKTIGPDGEVNTEFVYDGVNSYEVVGMLQTHLDTMRAVNTANLFVTQTDHQEEDG